MKLLRKSRINIIRKIKYTNEIYKISIIRKCVIFCLHLSVYISTSSFHDELILLHKRFMSNKYVSLLRCNKTFLCNIIKNSKSKHLKMGKYLMPSTGFIMLLQNY